MFINFYLVSTAITWVSFVISDIKLKKKIEREGYEEVKNKKSILEKIVDFIRIFITLSFPFVNIVYTVKLLLNWNFVLEGVINDCLREGDLKHKSNEMSTEEYMNYCAIRDGMTKQEKEYFYGQEDEEPKKSETYVEKCVCRTCEEMTRQQKLDCLEQERERLINQSIDGESKDSTDVFTEGQLNAAIEVTKKPKQK